MQEEYWEPDCAPVLDAIAAWLGPPHRYRSERLRHLNPGGRSRGPGPDGGPDDDGGERSPLGDPVPRAG